MDDEGEFVGFQGHNPGSEVDMSSLQIDSIMPIEVISLAILRNLTFKDLLTCSLVNRQWNFLSRKVLYDNRKCSASLILEDSKEDYNLKIIKYLQTTPQKLFNHLLIKMSFGNNHDCEHDCADLLHQINSIQLSHTNFKRLSLWISFSHEENCHAFEIVKILCRLISSPHVEHLTLHIRSFRNEIESCPAFKDAHDEFLFKNLKSLELFVNSSNKHEILEVFFKNARYLQEIRGKIEVSDLRFFLSHNKCYLVKNLDLTQARSSDLENIIIKFAKTQPLLIKCLSVDDNFLLPGTKYLWGRILNLICLSSQNTLESLSITIPMLNVLAQVCPTMSKLRNLHLIFKSEVTECFQILNSIPLHQIFPGLQSIKINHPSQENRNNNNNNNRVPEEFFEHYRNPEEPVSPVVNSVETITCVNKNPYVFFEPCVIRNLETIFPNVKMFTFEGTHNYDLTTLCRTLWTVWGKLETIRFSASPSEFVSLEPTLIGIFPEEWERWRDLKIKEGIALKDLQFAAVRPSLRNCSNLQNFLVHLHCDMSYKNFTEGLLDIRNEIHPMIVKLAYTGARGNLF